MKMANNTKPAAGADGYNFTEHTQPEKTRPWHGVVTEEDMQVYRAAGLGQPTFLGKRAGLLVIDMQYRTVGESSRPILESINEYATSCGEFGWRAVPHVAKLIGVFRRHGLPVIFPHVAPKGTHDEGRFADKVPNVMKIPPRGYEFVREVAPQPGDICIPKFHASAFFGTPLASYLVDLELDSLVVTGCTTSGCVRATVVDAASLNYRVVVPEECVYDRSTVSHAVNLFDMASKYAEVMPVRELMEVLDRQYAAAGKSA
jgi:maleamate amidohydrolase